MSDRKKVFIDTNILIYRSFGTSEQKSKIQKLIVEHTRDTYISAQVLNEFINASVKKKLFKSEALLDETLEFFVANFKVVPVETNAVLKANYIRNRYQLAHYDSVIIASALDNKCEILYTEDIQNNLIIEKKLKIVNPFK